MPQPDPLWRQAARCMIPAAVRRRYYRGLERRRLASLRRGGHEPAVSAALRRLIRPGMVVADVGANTGLHTLLLADRVGPAGKVIAYEPLPENVRLLQHHLAAAGLLVRVEVVEAAVADGTQARVALCPGRRCSGREWRIADAAPGSAAPELSVRCVSLDAHFPRGAALDVVKIDVEGAESLVLQGMQRVLADARPAIVLEVHSPAQRDRCAALLEPTHTLTPLGGETLGAPGGGTGHLVALPRAAATPRAQPAPPAADKAA